MFSDEAAQLVSSRGCRLPVCVYGTLRSGEPARARLVDQTDTVAVADARLPGHRLMATDPGSPRWPGYAMAVPAARESVAAELVALRPDRHDEVLAALDAYEFAGYSPTDPECPYVRRRLEVLLPLDEWGYGPTVAVPAWVYLPGAALWNLQGRARDVPGGDWARRDTAGVVAPAAVGGSR